MPWTTGGRDAQIAELLKLSDEHITMAFGVPSQVLGIGDAKYANAEALMAPWVGSGLGFALAHIEASFDKLFRLAGEPREYCRIRHRGPASLGVQGSHRRVDRGIAGRIVLTQ